MYKLKFILCTFLFVLLSGSNLLADNTPLFKPAPSPGQSRIIRSRLTLGPVIGFYKINKNHAASPTQKMSGLISFSEEIRLTYKHNSFLLIGVDYMVHGVNFNSYYFKPDSIQLYTGDMNYNYSIYFHEFAIPIQLKLCFNHENNARFTPYVMIGYHFRVMMDAQLKVKQDGELVHKTYEVIEFKNKLFSKRNNPFMSFTLGMQKNNLKTYRNCFFAELTYRYGFSPYLLKDTFTASSLYITGNHLNLGLGVKF
jgi:hypothetical protein